MSRPRPHGFRRAWRSGLAPVLGPALAAALLLPGRAAGAQVSVIDEGTFTLTVGGERVGREDFSIRSTRSGGVVSFVAQGTMMTGGSRLTVALNLDSVGAPLRLQTEMREGPDVVESYAGRRERGIWSGRAVRPDGESARELLFPAGALVAEERLVHHLWLVMRFGRGRSVTLIAPRTLAERAVRIEEGGAAHVVLGRRELPARQWAIRDASDGELLWEVWTDAAGRVLRAVDPARGLEALRDEPPA